MKEIESEVRNKEYISLFLSEIMTSKKEVMKEVSKKKEKALRLNSPYLTFNSLQKTPFFHSSTIFGIFFFLIEITGKESQLQGGFFSVVEKKLLQKPVN